MNEEQKQGATKQGSPYENEDNTVSTAEGEVSNESNVVEDEGTQEEEKLTFTKTEFNRAVQSAADKSTATARRNALKEAQEAKAEAAKTKAEADAQLQAAQWRGATEALSKTWIEKGFPEEAVAEWNRDRYALTAAWENAKREKSEYAPKVDRADRHDAADEAIASVYGEDGLDRLTPAQYRAIVNAAEGDTRKEKLAYAKLKALELKAEVKAPAPVQTLKVRRPDPGTTTSVGGVLNDAAFKKGIGDGSLELNKGNMERARKLGLT